MKKTSNKGGELKFKKVQKNRSRVQHDYYTSVWDKLISKTQNTNDDLHRGDYCRSKQRDKDERSGSRTMNPNYYDVGTYAQTVKHSTSKTVSFKPPLVPNKGISGCPR